MATVYDIQGFDTTTTLSHLGGSITEAPDILASSGRVTGNRFRTPNNNDVWQKANVTALNPATSALGFAWFYSRRPSSGVTTPVGSILDGSSRQCEWGINADGQLVVMRNGTTLGTATDIIYTDVWYYIELKATIHNTTGSFELRVNGVSVLSATNQDTQTSANAYANGYQVGQLGNSATNLGVTGIDDLYYASDFLGDINVMAIYPSAEGNTTMFSASTGGNNAALVDETPPNSDTDYVVSPVVSDKDTYATGDLGKTGTIHAVKVKLWAKEVSGNREVAPVIRSDGADYDGTSQAVTTSYAYYDQLYNTNPDTAAAWTDDEVDAAEFGIKVTA